MKQEGNALPPDATTIAPPEGGLGHKLVFDVVAQCWEVHTSQPTELNKPLRKGTHSYLSGSYLIFIGIMLWFAALCDGNKYIACMSGLSLILGSIAYMSLKERMLYPTSNTRLRKYLELGSILLIFLGYLWELSTPMLNNTIILLNSITPITSIAIYLYSWSSWLKRDQASRFRGSNVNNPLLNIPFGTMKTYRKWQYPEAGKETLGRWQITFPICSHWGKKIQR